MAADTLAVPPPACGVKESHGRWTAREHDIAQLHALGAARPPVVIPRDDWSVRIWTLCANGRLKDALAIAGQAHRANPLEPNYCHAAARIARWHGDSAAARAWLDRAVRCPCTTEYHRRQAVDAHIHLGDWTQLAEAAAVFEAAGPRMDGPLWCGEPLPTETLLVQRRWLVGPIGYGDVLMNVAFVPICARLARRVILDVPPPLMTLLASTFSSLPNVLLADVDARYAEALERDYRPVRLGAELRYDRRTSWCWGLSSIFGATGGQPFLRPPACSRRLDLGVGFHVGVVWAGSGVLERESLDPLTSRSAPLRTLAGPLSAVPGIVLHSLQVGPAAAELEAFPAIRRHEFQDFADTARLAVRLDAVVSIDTSVCHLAGGLGVPTLTLLPTIACWRWGVDGETTPCYRSMRLLRQQRPGDWVSVGRKAARLLIARDLPPRLGAALASRATTAAPADRCACLA